MLRAGSPDLSATVDEGQLEPLINNEPGVHELDIVLDDGTLLHARGSGTYLDTVHAPSLVYFEAQVLDVFDDNAPQQGVYHAADRFGCAFTTTPTPSRRQRGFVKQLA